MKSLLLAEKPAATGKNSHEIGRFKAAKPAAFLPFAAGFLPNSAGSLPETCRFLAGGSQNLLIRAKGKPVIERSIQFALESPLPDASEVFDNVFVDPDPQLICARRVLSQCICDRDAAAWDKLEAVMVISLFIACYNDVLFPQTGKAIVAVLERLGHTVEFRQAQTCCGQMHYNSGYQADAAPLMRKFVNDFRTADVICCPSSSCVSMIREHYPKLAASSGDAALVRDVDALLPRVFEFSELLVDKLGVTDVGAFYPHTVTFHTSCHALRSLHVGDKPLELLRKVRGLTLIELPNASQCCGFGGTFSVKNADVSAAMLSEKIHCILETRAEVCAGGDNSCLLHIGGGMSRQRTGVSTVHLAEILASTEETAS